tara:strand:- start:204 stop:452 length:249 start_codon:yes stop_codon:yes gene_type:complete
MVSKEDQRLDDLATELVGYDILDVMFSDGPLQKINFLGWMRKLAPDDSELARAGPRETIGLADYLVKKGIVALDSRGYYLPD